MLLPHRPNLAIGETTVYKTWVSLPYQLDLRYLRCTTGKSKTFGIDLQTYKKPSERRSSIILLRQYVLHRDVPGPMIALSC